MTLPHAWVGAPRVIGRSRDALWRRRRRRARMPVVDLEGSIITASDGAELAVHSSSGVGRTVLLLHGFTLDHRSWSAVAPNLAHAGFSVVAVDLRGHGQSGLGSAPPALGRLSEDVFDVLAQLGLSDVVVIGHSLGAFVALDVRADPKAASRVRGVVAISGMTTSIRNPFVKAGRGSSVRRSVLAWCGTRSSAVPCSRHGSGRARRTRRSRRLVSGPQNVHRPGAAQWVEPPLGSIYGPTYGRLTRPRWSCVGPTIAERPYATPVSIADSIDGAELASIPNAGHMVITEQPAPVATALLRWLGALDRQ